MFRSHACVTYLLLESYDIALRSSFQDMKLRRAKPTNSRPALFLSLVRRQYLRARRRPHTVVSHDVVQRVFQHLDSMRLAGAPRMDRQSHDAPTLGFRLSVKGIEVIANLLREFALRLAHMQDNVLITDFVRVRHGVDFAR